MVGVASGDITSFSNSYTWTYNAGVPTLTYGVYHPMVNGVTNATMTITVSGECVDNAQMAHTSVTRSVTIYPCMSHVHVSYNSNRVRYGVSLSSFSPNRLADAKSSTLLYLCWCRMFHLLRVSNHLITIICVASDDHTQ